MFDPITLVPGVIPRRHSLCLGIGSANLALAQWNYNPDGILSAEIEGRRAPASICRALKDPERVRPRFRSVGRISVLSRVLISRYDLALEARPIGDPWWQRLAEPLIPLRGVRYLAIRTCPTPQASRQLLVFKCEMLREP